MPWDEASGAWTIPMEGVRGGKQEDEREWRRNDWRWVGGEAGGEFPTGRTRGAAFGRVCLTARTCGEAFSLEALLNSDTATVLSEAFSERGDLDVRPAVRGRRVGEARSVASLMMVKRMKW